jgi:competence protein ComEC
LLAGCAIGLVLLLVAGVPRLVLCVAVAGLVPAGAFVGAVRLAAIDRSPLRQLAGRDMTLRGYVVRRERTIFGVRRVRLRVTAVEGSGPVSDLVQLRVAKDVRLSRRSIGDELVATGTLELPRRRVGDTFDYAAYLQRAGVHAILRARFVEPTGDRRGGLAGAVDALRRRAEAGVSAGLSPSLAALARGMVLGEDEDVSERTSDDFKRSGLAHVLAVSGQNVTLLAVLAWPLLALLGLGRGARLVGVLALIAVYVPLTGAGPSILRAGVMGAAGTVAALSGRLTSRWYSLLLAAAITLALDPRAWQDVGWQLSFAAVAGIFLLVPALMRKLRRLPEPLAAGAAMTIAATLATAPLMSLHFGRVSLVSLLANLLALPAIAPIMWVGMLASAAAQVSLAPAELMNALAAYLLGYVSSIARWSAAVPGAVLRVQIGSAFGLASGYAVIVAVVAALGRRRRGTVLASVGAAVLATVAVAGARRAVPAPPSRFVATFLDVGQGDATLFQAPGASVLVDGGPPEAGVVAKLRSHGLRSLDVVVLTHEQRDHEGGLEAVVRSIPVRLLLDGGAGSKDRLHERILALARDRGIRVVRPVSGEEVAVGDLRLRVLAPSAGSTPDPDEDPNQHAAVLTVSHGSLDFFMPADAESDVTGGLPLRPVEVLKVAHHGSDDEGLHSLLERLHPKTAVIEVGEGNPYGHPASTTTSTLGRMVPHVFRTDQDGEITATADSHGLAFHVEH